MKCWHFGNGGLRGWVLYERREERIVLQMVQQQQNQSGERCPCREAGSHGSPQGIDMQSSARHEGVDARDHPPVDKCHQVPPLDKSHHQVDESCRCQADSREFTELSSAHQDGAAEHHLVDERCQRQPRSRSIHDGSTRSFDHGEDEEEEEEDGVSEDHLQGGVRCSCQARSQSVLDRFMHSSAAQILDDATVFHCRDERYFQGYCQANSQRGHDFTAESSDHRQAGIGDHHDLCHCRPYRSPSRRAVAYGVSLIDQIEDSNKYQPSPSSSSLIVLGGNGDSFHDDYGVSGIGGYVDKSALDGLVKLCPENDIDAVKREPLESKPSETSTTTTGVLTMASTNDWVPCFLDQPNILDTSSLKEADDAGGEEGGDGKAPVVHAWYLVDGENKKLRLPTTMLFLGRDECDILVQSGTVDKRHAVITFDLYLSRFKVKDLSTTNGTYVNESRIPEQEYVTLNHMDSIRLGNDSKVYHMEQGEPCEAGDSPPPPPLPLQPPPLLAPHPLGEGDNNHNANGVEGDLPAWVSGNSGPDRMAECQGCIAEQRIEHTCSQTHGGHSGVAGHAQSRHQHHHPDHHSQHPHHCHGHGHADDADYQHIHVDREAAGHTTENMDTLCAAATAVDQTLVGKSLQEPEAEATPDDLDLDPEAAGDQPKVKVGRNTWPRKRVRQLPHVAAIFDDDCGDGSGSAIQVETGSNYLVSSVDDSVCDAGGKITAVSFGSLSRSGSVQRILRNSKLPLPPELETVKKGTPLYGQPAWWGEDLETNGDKSPAMESREHHQHHQHHQHPPQGSPSSRPSSLVVHPTEEGGGRQSLHHHHQQQQHAARGGDSRAVYMEIPHHDSLTPERDKPPGGGTCVTAGGAARDKSTPSRSVTSSLSKDSLVLTPGSGRGDENGGGGGAGGESLSFTVDFGDEKKPKLKSGASLSEFVPTKIRNSLSSHHARPASSDKSAVVVAGSVSSAPSSKQGSAKNSEEREISPTRQKRLDDLWGAESPAATAGTKGKAPRRSSAQATGVASLKTADFSSEGPSVADRSRDSRRETERRSRESDRETDKKPPKSPKTREAAGRKSSPRAIASATTVKLTKPKALPTAAALAASATAAQYADPTAYLIDRMFAGVTDSSPRSSDSSERERSDSPAAPEHAMYKEAKDFDRANHHRGERAGSAGGAGVGGGSLTYRASEPRDSRPPGTASTHQKSQKDAEKGKKKPLRKGQVPASSAVSANPALRRSLEKDDEGLKGLGLSLMQSPRSSRAASESSDKPPPASAALSPRSPRAPRLAESSRPSDPVAQVVGSPPQKTSSAKGPSSLPGGPEDEDDKEDKVSEAGTYTIEAEEDGAEEMIARQQIDEVFGVDVDSFSFERPVIGSVEQLCAPGQVRAEGQGHEDDDEAERTLHEDDDDLDASCRTPCEDDVDVFDYDEEDEDGAMDGVSKERAVPSWISQLNALTSGTGRPPAAPTTPTKVTASDGSKSLEEGTNNGGSKRQGGGLSRKRPGTGRKLPSIPSANGQSPVSSEHSSRLMDVSPDSPISGLNSSLSGQLENGHSRNGADSPSRSVTFSPVVSRGGDCGLRLAGSPCGSEDSSRLTNNGSSVSKTGGGLGGGGSLCSRGSIDTELLLRDTETVMAAMEARMGFHSNQREEEDEGGSDTDLSSTVAMVNGDDDYVKPTKYHSPREAITRKSSKDKDNSNIQQRGAASSSSLSTRKSLVRSFSEQKPPLHQKERGSRGSNAGMSVVSDVYSRQDSLDHSFQSDTSDGCSDHTDASFTRSNSRGKGPITMTKPNRAFALRRAHADGTETTTETARSRASAASSSASRRSSSMHGTARTPCTDRTGSTRTDTSLGAQIAKKARDNAGGPARPRDSSVKRVDTGAAASRRNSRGGSAGPGGGDRKTSTTPSSLSSCSTLSSATISSAKKERDIRSLRSQLKTGAGQKELAITGVSSRSQSQPGSRSNSPKAAERAAWKRRKEYDPRKAVAEAKAASKVKDTSSRPKPKVQAASLYKQRMIRSASFTNTLELSGRVRHETYSVESPSSVEDLSSAAMASESLGEASFRRAFIPFHNPLRSDRLSHSADEDEAGTFPTSQDSTCSLGGGGGGRKSAGHSVSLMLHKSAFTPPLSKLTTPSPDSPPRPASLLLRRRTLGAVDYDEVGASMGSAASSHRTQADSHRTPSSSPQSYDSLIVSSIYQLSLKLKTTTDKTLNKLREQDRVSITPSPIDDFLGHPIKSEIPAWKSANQELAGVLKNLRKMEHHLHLMERALFPDEDTDTDVSGMSSTEKHKYFQEIERIRSELAGFQPIDNPPRTEPPQDPGSPEMAELCRHIVDIGNL